MSVAEKGKDLAAEAPAFLGSSDGVTAVVAEGGFAVAFEFDRKLSSMMQAVQGAQYDKEAKLYVVPAASGEALGTKLKEMRLEFNAIEADRAAIEKLAHAGGLKAQRENGAGAEVASARVSDYKEVGKFNAGEIINANARFVAQLTGFGKDDGVAFVVIHRRADLDRGFDLMKGDNVGIKYDSKYLGGVTDLAKAKSAAELEADFDSELGRAVDGVTLTDRGDSIGVAFAVNPALMARLRRVDGATFNGTDKLWEVPAANKEFVLRAAHDMRTRFVAEEKDIAVLKGAAETKIDGAKVEKAFTKDGTEHFGAVVAVGSTHLLQKGGQDKFKLHNLAALDKNPVIGQNLSIKYNKGHGTVLDQEQAKAQGKALTAGR